MLMNILKGLFRSNRDTEAEEEIESPSSDPPNQPWQNFQPWGGAEAPWMMPPNAAPPNEAPSAEESAQEGRRFFRRTARSNPKNQRYTNRGNVIAPPNRIPSNRVPSMGQYPQSFPQPGGQFMPQPRAQQRMTPGASTWYGQPTRMTPPPSQFTEWGAPVQRRTVMPPGAFGVRTQSPMMYPPHQGRPMGSPSYPGFPRQPTQRQRWF